MIPINRGSAPWGLLSARIEMDRRLHGLTFSARDLNAAERGGLSAVGAWYVSERLIHRFDEFAKTDLGYVESQQDRGERDAFRRAMSSGLVQRIADRDWQGWNPWISSYAPKPLLTWFLKRERYRQVTAQGFARDRSSRSGFFKTLHRDMRQEVKADIRRKVRELSEAGEKFEKLPLVDTGELRAVALAGTRYVARVTAASSSLRISIPNPHARAHPKVDAVMRRMTTAEIDEATQVYGTAFEALVAGSVTTTIRRGPNAGQVRRSLTAEQRDSIANTPSGAGSSGRPSLA